MSEVEKLGIIEGLPLRLDEERGMSLWLDPEYAPNQPNVAITRDLLRRLCRAIQASDVEAEEAHKLGKGDGYEEAVADIDRLTGGDGEYVFSTLPGEGCPNPEAMKARIVERFEAAATLQSQARRVEELEGETEQLRGYLQANYRTGIALEARVEELEGALREAADVARMTAYHIEKTKRPTNGHRAMWIASLAPIARSALSEGSGSSRGEEEA